MGENTVTIVIHEHFYGDHDAAHRDISIEKVFSTRKRADEYIREIFESNPFKPDDIYYTCHMEVK